jgi:cysteinyl-tRNA synthetase
MKLFNTLTKKVEEFRPQNSPIVTLYTCGPTVYDYPHIGNWRSFVFDDTLRRTLEASHFEVKHVMNITDVGHLTSDADEGGDKLEAGAHREGKNVWDVANYYIEAFIKGAHQLNILPPSAYKGPTGPYARATDFIDDQLKIIKLLLDKGFAYQTEQAIYFDVTKLPTYGELTGQKLTEKAVGVRDEVVTDRNKKHPQDFAIWFFRVGRFADHEMRWPSPWGEGFPGWHLECSAIIHATLGEPIDIHTGGVDHIGTHHPNEMAQTEGAYGLKLARFWLHNEFMLVNGQKMAKSRGNFITLDNIIKKGYDPLALRVLFLQSHYRSQTNFTWESLTAAQSALLAFNAWADLQFQNLESRALADNYRVTMSKVEGAMANDLSTTDATGSFSGMVNQIAELGIDSAAIKTYAAKIDSYFGLNLSKRQDIGNDVKNLIAEREKARASQNWSAADRFRKQLAETGITLNDTPQGSVWSRA